MSLRAWMNPHHLAHVEEALGACTCDERHCERHERHRCELCAESFHVDEIAEPWPNQFWCPACVAKVWECDGWAESDANLGELERVGFVVPAIAEAAE